MSMPDLPATCKLRGRHKLWLVRELALGVRSQPELAEVLGITQQAVSYYRSKHAEQIDAARREIENGFAALWIADKANRLAELEADAERINEALESAEPADRAKLMAAKRAALRLASEELGQLAPKTINATVQVRYSVDGVDMGALR